MSLTSGRAGRTLALLAAILLVTATAGALAPGPAAGSSPPTVPGASDLLATRSGVVWSWGAAASNNSDVLRSTNGGRQWQVVLDVATPANGNGLTASYFLGVDDAWVVKQNIHGDGVGETTTVYSTSDGGAHWYHSKALPGDITTCCLILFDQIYFANPDDGWALAAGQDMAPGAPTTLTMLWWKSTDGGRSWSELPASALPTQGRVMGGLSPYLNCPSASSPHLTFATADIGWFSEGDCAAGVARPKVWWTTDAGAHWAPASLPPPASGWGDWFRDGNARRARGPGEVQPRRGALHQRGALLGHRQPARAGPHGAGNDGGGVVRSGRPQRMVGGCADRGLLDLRCRGPLVGHPLAARPPPPGVLQLSWARLRPGARPHRGMGNCRRRARLGARAPAGKSFWRRGSPNARAGIHNRQRRAWLVDGGR
jgi:hypothetical protein